METEKRVDNWAGFVAAREMGFGLVKHQVKYLRYSNNIYIQRLLLARKASRELGRTGTIVNHIVHSELSSIGATALQSSVVVDNQPPYVRSCARHVCCSTQTQRGLECPGI